jgi:hypothetical protein
VAHTQAFSPSPDTSVRCAVLEREQRVWAAGLLVARRAPAVHCAPCTYGGSGKPGGNKAAARGEGGEQRGLISRGGEKSGRIRSDRGARRPATRLPLGARARRRRALVVQAGRHVKAISERTTRACRFASAVVPLACGSGARASCLDRSWLRGPGGAG